MRKLTLTAVAALLLASAATAGPTAPNAKAYQNGISYAEFLVANGCTLVDMGGYSNAKGPDGGGCKALVDWSRSGAGYLKDTDADGVFDTWISSDY